MLDRPVDISILTAFSPLDGLKAENLHALARKTQIRELEAGRALFKEGDTEKRTFYLVAGTVVTVAPPVPLMDAAGSPHRRGAHTSGMEPPSTVP